MKNTHTESAPAMCLWLLVPVALIIAALTYSCECPAAEIKPVPIVKPVKPIDVSTYEKEIRSAPEYQLIRVYEGGKQTEKQYQYEWKKGKWKRVKVKDGVWTKHDDKKPKKIKDVKPVISRILKTISEWGMAYADESGDTAYENIINQPDYEIIWTYSGDPIPKQISKDVQSESLCDGSTICRVHSDKTYLNGWSQGFGEWTEEVDLI